MINRLIKDRAKMAGSAIMVLPLRRLLKQKGSVLKNIFSMLSIRLPAFKLASVSWMFHSEEQILITVNQPSIHCFVQLLLPGISNRTYLLYFHAINTLICKHLYIQLFTIQGKGSTFWSYFLKAIAIVVPPCLKNNQLLPWSWF